MSLPTYLNAVRHMPLPNHLDQIYCNRDTDALYNYLAEAHASVTFWGTRVIEVRGIEGSENLSTLIERTMHLWKYDQSPAAVHMKVTLARHLEQTDRELEQSNCLTVFFNYIREVLHALCYNDRNDPVDELRAQTSYHRVLGH